MKIECDKCSAKYSIADEKVRGKTFKIRCKKCSNVIIVRDKVAAAAGGGGGADVAVDQGHAGWHLAINGETVGPMSEDEVRARYDAGEIDKDTAIWQEGFEDWVPLGDVDAFADLPDRAIAARGDDPFASANQDDYAAAGAMMSAPAAAVGASPMQSYAQPQAQAQSPRVSSLTGQRNENSVLFSLDSLQSLATGGPSAARSSTRAASKGLATSAPGSEGSGLIDIRALGAMVGEDHRGGGHVAAPGAAADDTALPSFGGAGLGGLAAAPLVAHPIEPAVAAAAMAQPPARSNAPLYFMMAILILAVVGLGVYIAVKPPPEAVVVTQNPEAPSVKAAGADEEEEDEEDGKKKKKAKDEEEEEEEGEGEEEGKGAEGEEAAEDGELADGSDPKNKGKSKTKSKGKTTSSGGGKDPLADFPSSSGSTKSSASGSSGSSSSSKSQDVDVDCILDPKACGKGKSGSSGGSSSSTPKPSGGSNDPSLPEKLSTTDIRDGINPVKGAAKACGSKHGAKPGEKVKVKLSISGATGAVTSATAEPPHNGTPLGNCVAAALKRAKFKRFQKASLGAVYPVSM